MNEILKSIANEIAGCRRSNQNRPFRVGWKTATFPFRSAALIFALDRESDGFDQPCDEVGVNRGSRFGVVFANRVVAVVRHEEGVALDGESEGLVQPCDEAGANRGSGGSVVFANRVAQLV